MIIKPIAVEYDMWYFTTEDDASFFGVYGSEADAGSAYAGWIAIFDTMDNARDYIRLSG